MVAPITLNGIWSLVSTCQQIPDSYDVDLFLHANAIHSIKAFEFPCYDTWILNRSYLLLEAACIDVCEF